jgi:S-formylglutathione hydrolase FrmB
VEELLPAVERELRGLGEREARLLVGHSSGAWGALWLMLHFPDTFGACWASSPDPLDFHDFMGVDLYAEGANLFRDERGQPRPFAVLDRVSAIGYLREHSDRERVLRGGPLAYFEAILGPRGADGRPARLWDRGSGAIDPAVARAWARQDLSRLLQRRWDELGPKLAGRVTVTVGDRDTYLLRGSVERFQRAVTSLGGGLRVRVMPGDHFSVRSGERDGDEVERLLGPYRAWRRAAGGER